MNPFRLFSRLARIEEAVALAERRYEQTVKAIEVAADTLKPMVMCADCRAVLHESGVAVSGTNGEGKAVAFCRWCAQTLRARGLVEKKQRARA